MNFREKILQLAKQIPYGKVATYGQLAALADSPRAGRVVGGILSSLGANETDIPWWRVVNKEGYISIRGHMPEIKELQKQLLETEGVEVSDEYCINLQQYLS